MQEIYNSSCSRCSLAETCKTICVPGTGNIKKRIVLVGEAPGRKEDLQGLPFLNLAGKELDEYLTCAGLTREDVYITNAVKCRPPKNRTPNFEEIKSCSYYLSKELNEIFFVEKRMNSGLIILMGAVALRSFYFIGGFYGQVTQRFGDYTRMTLNYKGIPVRVTFHPAAAIYDPSKKDMIRKSFKIIGNLI